ncbi:MAG: toll/interleukin-1 receptor domain-containing protein [Pseudanabaenaceae cyanobacterium]
MTDAFISYSRKDKEFVSVLYTAFERSRKNIWVDWNDIPLASDWWAEIEKGIEAADTFVFVISPDSIASEVCAKEILHAVRHNKRLFPIVRRDATNFEVGNIAHEKIKQHNWLMFREQDNFESAFQTLIKTISLDLEHLHAHTRLLVRAIEWDNNGRELSFLLRGKDLELAETWLSEGGDKDPKPTESQVTYIDISRKMEDANQKITLMHQRAFVVGLIMFMIALVGSVGVVFLIRQSASMEIDDYRNKTRQSQEETHQAQEDAKKAQNDYIQLKEQFKQKGQEAVAESNSLSANLSANKTESGNKNTLIYIQVPSELVRSRISYLKTKFKSKGYNVPSIEIVGESISPDKSDIRYFSQGQKKLAEKLKQDLISIDPKYQDFKIKYVKGFENRSQPLEIWFEKDTK